MTAVLALMAAVDRQCPAALKLEGKEKEVTAEDRTELSVVLYGVQVYRFPSWLGRFGRSIEMAQNIVRIFAIPTVRELRAKWLLSRLASTWANHKPDVSHKRQSYNDPS